MRKMVSARLAKTLTLVLWGALLCLLLWETGSRRQPKPAVRLSGQFSGDLPACMAIVQGDAGDSLRELKDLLAVRVRKKLLSEEFYLNATKDCPAYVGSRGFITETLSAEERDFPIAYSMVIHDQVEMFERLLRAIYAPQNTYCVHVDSKSSQKFKSAAEAIASCFPNVFIATKLEKVVYASWSRVQADLNCMQDLLKSPVRWRYLLNTCGTDFPIKTNREMVRTLKLLNGRNSMETERTSDLKKGRWQYRHDASAGTVVRTGEKKSPPPISSPMFSGNAYFVVSREFVEHLLLSDGEVRKLLDWEKDTYSPDEHLWATLQRMHTVPGSLPANSKYDTSDMMAVARAVKWGYLAGDVRTGAPYEPCTGTYRRSVCVYGAGDIPWLLSQRHLLANKFDPVVDDVAIRCLEAFLHAKALGYLPMALGRDSTTLMHFARVAREGWW